MERVVSQQKPHCCDCHETNSPGTTPTLVELPQNFINPSQLCVIEQPGVSSNHSMCLDGTSAMRGLA
jgi:hypothetical protein